MLPQQPKVVPTIALPIRILDGIECRTLFDETVNRGVAICASATKTPQECEPVARNHCRAGLLRSVPNICPG